MRCLTLAEALRKNGAECYFICRMHDGHLLEFIRLKGFKVYSLDQEKESEDYSHWLGASPFQDITACIKPLQTIKPDWLIVDHYSLDIAWESALRHYCRKVMVIDDLADRQHDCDILLDQTFGRSPAEYTSLVAEHCRILCGSRYAILRPEFLLWREYSLQRRQSPQLRNIIISLGGVDNDNITTKILDTLESSYLKKKLNITVVLGKTSPWAKKVTSKAAQIKYKTNVKVDVKNMAELMSNSDLAIGAAGATTWERCCLGLPTIQLVLAENQREIAASLEKINAAILIYDICDIPSILNRISPNEMHNISSTSKKLIDGLGCYRNIKEMIRS